jgi:hypothetical protein
MEKKQIISSATSRLNQYLCADNALPATLEPFKMEKQAGDFSLVYQAGGASSDTVRYPVFVQSWAPQKDINTLISQLKAMPDNAILLADFINPVMADKLRRRSINFADCAGNLSLKTNGFDCFVKGQRAVNLRGRRVRGRAFNSAGLKLIFALFSQPHFLNTSYREISNKVNIALGSVGPVMDDLFASGYILDDGERRLVNKKRLFERWVDGYLEKLRPKQIMACYRSEKKDWWKKADPYQFAGFWGGEVLIARDTPYMIPESITLYFQSEKKQKQFAEANQLVEDEDGDICFYRPFWSPRFIDTENDAGISPLIVYADIVDSINPGAWDVAKTFYGESVAHLLKD